MGVVCPVVDLGEWFVQILWNIRFALLRLKPDLHPGWGWDETTSVY